MSHEDIEATKAPLMDHLIELRSRLIKALLAFGVMFGVCFIFAKDIYNVLVWPFVWVAGPENSKFIYTALLEYFITQLKLAMFGAAFLSFPVVATQIYMFVAPGLYRHERKAFLPYLIATPIFFTLGAAVVYFLVLPMLVQGVSMAFFFVSVITIQLDGIPPQRVPAATSISNFLRITAGAFSTYDATRSRCSRVTPARCSVRTRRRKRPRPRKRAARVVSTRRSAGPIRRRR